MSKKRKKGEVGSNDTADARPLSCVSTKLVSVLADTDPVVKDALLHRLQTNATVLSKALYDANLFANLHILRCIQEDQPLPELTSGFFKSCLVLMTDTNRESDKQDLYETFALHFAALRPDGAPLQPNAYMNQCRSTLAVQMETNVMNHVVTNFMPILRRYIALKFGLQDAKEVYEFLAQIYFPEDKKDKKAKIEETITPVVLSSNQVWIRDWLTPHNPFFESHLKSNMLFFVSKMHVMLGFFESKNAEFALLPKAQEKRVRKKKCHGTRQFSLLPYRSKADVAFIHFDSTSLVDVIKSLRTEIKTRIFARLKEHFASDIEISEFLRLRQTMREPFADKRFEDREHIVCQALWRQLFKVSSFETVNRKFDHRIGTNGYAATVQMRRAGAPIRAENVDEELDKAEFDPLPDDCSSYQTFIGIDPGSNYIFNAYSGEAMNGRPKITRASNPEWKVNAGIATRNAKERRLRKSQEGYMQALAEIGTCSLKTTDLDKMKTTIRTCLKHRDFMFAFASAHGFARSKFTVMVHSAKTRAEFVKRVIGKDAMERKHEAKILVGFGDWSSRDGFIKGKEKAPCKGFRKELRRHVTVVKIDEHRTSVTCCKCQGLENMENGVRNGKSCHQLLECKTCNVVWHRDCNASVNIRNVLLCLVRKEARPVAMSRKPKTNAERL